MARAIFVFVAVLVATLQLSGGARVNQAKYTEVKANFSTSLERYRTRHAEISGMDVEFLDFDKIIAWAKNEAKDILTSIKAQTLATIDAMKDKIREQIVNFKQLLLETRDKCVIVLQGVKTDMVNGLQKLKTVAIDQLPKFYDNLDGLKAKLLLARDALTSQLLAGSLTGAGDVLQQQMAILMNEAKLAVGETKKELLASAEVMKDNLDPILTNGFNKAKDQFTDVFSESMKSATVLVDNLLSDVKLELANRAKAIATSTVNQLQTAADKALATAKAGGFALVDLTAVPDQDLKNQLLQLQQSRADLVSAAAQATSAQTEKTVDTATSLGEQIGRYAMQLVDEKIMPELRAAKEKAMKWLNEKLTNLRQAAFTASENAVNKLMEINKFAGTKAKELLTKYGPDAKDWAEKLQQQALDFVDCKLQVEAARAALENAVNTQLVEKAGRLQIKLQSLVGDAQTAARKELGDLEEQIAGQRTAAYKAAKAASASLETAGSKASEALTDIKVSMRQKGKENDPGLKADLAALKEQAEDVWSVAIDYGRQVRGALDEGLSALAQDSKSNGADGWAKLLDDAGQCQKAAYGWCCSWGTPCDCTKDANVVGQCSLSSYKFCCQVGTPCRCNRPFM